MSQSLVSVVIPAFNAGRYMSQTLNSVRLQTYQRWEVIVTNDGGTDDTPRIVSEFTSKVSQNVQLIEHAQSQGPSAARNTGMKAANGDIIAFLDADDFWTPGHLEALCSVLEKGEADLAYADGYVFRNTPAGEMELLPIDTIEVTNPPKDLFKRNFINPSGAAISRKLMENVGEFDVALRGVEDIDYWIRAVTRGFQIAPTGEKTYYYRKSAGGLSAASARMEEGGAKICEKHSRCGILPESEILAKARDGYYAAGKLYWRKNPRAASESFYKAWVLDKYRLMPVMAAVFTRFLSWMPPRVMNVFAGR